MREARDKPDGCDADQTDVERFGFDDPDETWINRLRAAEDLPPLGRIGSIEVIEEIGRGGQGIVYRARQAGIGRPIALKKLRSGVLATPHMQRRFEREIEIVSALNHPNIVRIFGLEVTDSQPMLAMEWIDGVSVDQWAGRIRESPGEPLDALLNVFQSVGAAVKYAHEHGVIHRDLKPSNILIDEQHEPRIVDFGLAKPIKDSVTLASSADVTGESEFLGTPAYASPEQIEGRSDQVDTRSDVYSLGVVLYEMLCGARPYDLGQSWTDAIRRIERVEPSPLGPRTPFRIDRDLEAIVMKALQHEPGQRYQSVESLLADLQRYRRGEAVMAHPPTVSYQLRKLLNRHRTAVLFSTALLTMVLAAAAIITTLSLRAAQTEAGLRREADDQRDHAKVLYERAETARAQAQAEADKAGEIHRFFDWLLTSVAPQAGKGPNVTVREVLEGADQYVATYLEGQPEAEAAIRGTIGSTYTSLGLYNDAIRHLRIALALRIANYGQDDRRTAVSKGNLAAALAAANQVAEAETLEREAVAYFRENCDDADRLVHELYILAEILRRGERYDEAEPLLQEAHEILTRTAEPGNAADIMVLNVLGAVYYAQHKYEQATAVFESLLEQIRRVEAGRHQIGITTLLNNLAGARMGLGDLAGAEVLVREALDIMRQTAGPEHPSTVKYTTNLAQLLVQEGKLQDSEELFRQAIPLTEKAFGASSADTAAVYENYAGLLAAMERPDEAVTYFHKSLDARLAFDDVHNEETQRLVDRFVAFLVEQHREAEASNLHDQIYGQPAPQEESSTDSPSPSR